MYTKNWTDSVTACQEMEAQLVVIKSHEDQVFLVVIPILVWVMHLTTGLFGRRWLVRQNFLDKELLGQVGK
jgi:hypothetical protein